ncbi:MAG: Crp/Fnr family transcriptional regulator [Candidatus Methanofastidiosa archaeon]|nr:Crp/Fnr family transcriptional regulator [Candidatus Methanofastidiosa archaeon]
MSIDDLLKSCPASIQKSFKKKKYKKGEKIIFQGSKNDYVYFLLSGELKVYCILPDGEEYVVEYLKDFVLVGEIELFLQKTAITMVEASTNCELLKLEKSKFLLWLEEDWIFNYYMLVSFAKRVSYLAENAAMRFSTTVDERLQILLQRASTEGSMEIYKSNIYNELYTTQRSMNRSLKKFVDQKLIEVNENKIFILKTDKHI